MPRPTIKVKLCCLNCKKDFEILRWEYHQKQRRRTSKYYCSAKCKNKVQRLGGELSPSWKGGRRMYPSQKGYVMLRVAPNKRMFEHRFLMEKHLGRKLKVGEVVHHINGNPSDNRVENLVVCRSAGYHTSTYHPRKYSADGRFIPKSARLVIEEKFHVRPLH